MASQGIWDIQQFDEYLCIKKLQRKAQLKLKIFLYCSLGI